MISHKHKFIFVHIPKTAGTSIEQRLLDESCHLLPGEWALSLVRHTPLNHLTLQEMVDYSALTPAQLKSYFKFCFVRNPRDRLISEIFCPWMSPWFGDLIVEQHIRRACELAVTPTGIANHLCPQHDFVIVDGLQMDFVGRFAHLDEDFGQICILLGIADSLPHLNHSDHQPYQGYYDEQIQALVSAAYRRDIDAFQYKFGGVAEEQRVVQATPRKSVDNEKGTETIIAPLAAPKLEKGVPQVSRSEVIKSRPGYDQPVIWLVGDGRSGTTWLADLINYRQNYRFMFEPLTPWTRNFLSCQEHYPYLRPHEGQDYVPQFEQLFSGHVRHPRVDQYASPDGDYQGLLIKDILGHLCLKWVGEHFPQVKKVLLLRHPFAVAISKIKLSQQQGWYWLQEPKRLFAQSQLYEDFLQPFTDIVPLAASQFEKQVLIWSILHYIPLVQLNQEQIHLVYYEELCTNYASEIGHLLAYLGDDQPILDERLLKLQSQPSKMTQRFSAITQQRNLIDGWTQQLTADQLAKGEYILNAFGLDQIYNGHNLRPNREAAASFLKDSSYGGREIVGAAQQKNAAPARPLGGNRTITAYPLVDQPTPLQPAAKATTPRATAADVAPANINRPSWQLCCPVAFAATWNGGPDADDIEIRLMGDATSQPAFVQSNRGGGVLTFYPGYQFKTQNGYLLWLRGPINAPKDGLHPLESLVDASLLPCMVAMHWQFTRAHQTIHCAAGEPFATLLLYPKNSQESVQIEMVQAGEEENTHAQVFAQMVDNPALQTIFQRLGAASAESIKQEPKLPGR